MLSTDIEKEIRSTIEGVKKLKYEIGDINSRLSTISDRLSEPAYSKEFVDEFKSCCCRLSAPMNNGGVTAEDMDNMFGTVSVCRVLKDYSAEYIVEAVREFDKKKQLERDQTFRIGEEVEVILNPKVKGIILENSEPDKDYITVWTARGNVLDGVYKTNFKKTGRRFDSIDRWIETELKKEDKS